jgi:hypothetical protein
MRIMLCVLFILGASVAFSKKPPAPTTCDGTLCTEHAQEHYNACMAAGGDEKRCNWIAHQAYLECKLWCR